MSLDELVRLYRVLGLKRKEAREFVEKERTLEREREERTLEREREERTLEREREERTLEREREERILEREREERTLEREREERTLEREREKEKALERQKERAHKIRIMEIRLGITSKFDKNVEGLYSEKNKSADRVRKLEEEKELKIELADPKQEKAVLPSISGSELSRQITSSRESPTKGENVFSQRKVSDEKKTSPSQDLLFQPETFAEKEATLSRGMSIPPALSKQEENEDEVFSSSSEIEHSGISIPKCESVDTQESEERGCSVETTISSETESQIRQPRMGISEFEFESDVEFNMFDRKSTTEEKEEHEHDLTVTTSRYHSLHNEDSTIKKSYLECEKYFLSYSAQDKHNSEDLDKGPVVNQDYGILIQQGVKNKKKFDIHVIPKFGEDHMDVSIKKTVKFQVEENKLFNSRSEEENKQKINQSYSVTPSKEINIFKISREVEPEPESKIKSNALNGKAIVEKKKEEYKYALHIAKKKHDSSCHEQEAVKLIQLNCEKEFCIESLHTEHQSLPDIQMDSLISLL
ncbi:UNVERIFIED_CONTAM: hypothetical protein RMT77_018135 [Armadillidium vulgare]